MRLRGELDYGARVSSLNKAQWRADHRIVSLRKTPPSGFGGAQIALKCPYWDEDFSSTRTSCIQTLRGP